MLALGFLAMCALCCTLSAEACYTPKYGNNRNDHTMCLKPNNCAAGKDLVTGDGSKFSMYDRQAVLMLHNKLRSIVATGKLPNFPPARNMNELTWDDELAEVAQRWAEQCTFEHDKNRNVDRFRVGQNIAFKWWFPGPALMILINATIAMFNEVNNPGYPASYISKFQSVPQTGHFTQIVWANTTRMGCGRSVYKEKRKGMTGETKLLVCNFGAAGNTIGWPVYEAGKPDCRVFSKHYQSLCTTSQNNKEFKEPCLEQEFKKLFLPLCKDGLFDSLGIHGTIKHETNYSDLILLTLALMLLAAATMGLLCFLYRRILLL